MDGIVKRVAVAVLLLALLGVAACGEEKQPSASAQISVGPPFLPDVSDPSVPRMGVIGSRLRPIVSDDLGHDALKTKLDALSARGPDKPLWWEVDGPWRIESELLTELLPGYAFYRYRLTCVVHEGNPERLSIPAPFSVTETVTPEGHLYDSGGLPGALRQAGVRVLSSADALRIWRATCVVHQASPGVPRVLHPEPTSWHVHHFTDDAGTTYYYEISVDDEGRIQGTFERSEATKGSPR